MTSPQISADFQVCSLQDSVTLWGWPNEHTEALKRYATSLTIEKNGEHGPDFWTWILESYIENLARYRRAVMPDEHALIIRECAPFETLYVIKQSDKEVVGTISSVRDDRGWGKKYDLEGIWLGGLNVHPDYRGRGLGGCLFYNAMNRIRVLAVTRVEQLRVNLFTQSDVVKGMAARRGFIHNDGLAMDSVDAGRSHYYQVFGL